MIINEKIRKRLDAQAEKRQSWKDRNKYYYDEQEKYFRFLVSKGLSILEVGCENGHLLNSLQPKRGVGIEFSSRMLDIAKKIILIWNFG